MQVVQLYFPKNTHKTRKNTEIVLEIGIFRVEICSVHRNSLERVFARVIFSQLCPAGCDRTCQQD